MKEWITSLTFFLTNIEGTESVCSQFSNILYNNQIQTKILNQCIDFATKNKKKYLCDLIIIEFYYSIINSLNNYQDNIDEIHKIHNFIEFKFKKLINQIKILCNQIEYQNNNICIYLLRFTNNLLQSNIVPISNDIIKDFEDIAFNIIENIPNANLFTYKNIISYLFNNFFKTLEIRIFLQKLLYKPYISQISKYNVWDLFTDFEIHKLNFYCFNNHFLNIIPFSSYFYRLKSLIQWAITDDEHSLRLMPLVWRKSLYICVFFCLVFQFY